MRRAIRDDVLVSMEGAIDLHFHDYPDLFPRLGDDYDVALKARELGMRAILIKGHHEAATSRAYTVGRVVKGLDVFGGIVLNTYVGGINPAAVEACLRLGGKAVWMPTVDAGFHAQVHGSTGVYAAQEGGLQRADGIWILDEDEKLIPEINEVLALVAKYGVMLSTSHLSPKEIRILVPAAFAAGVQKVVITHPFYKVPHLDLDGLAEMVALGAYAEFEYCGVSPAWHVAVVESVVEAIERIGAERCALVSDAGQRHNPLAPEALRVYAQTLFEKGVPLDQVERMIKDNPAELLGLDPSVAGGPGGRSRDGDALRVVVNRHQNLTSAREQVAELLPESEYEAARNEIRSWDAYEPTPLVSMVGLAERLGLETVWLKDESIRLGLDSFKALGGGYAVHRVVDEHGKDVTVTSATDGNHGRSVARAATQAGCDCVIYLHATVSGEREDAIKALGARTVRVEGNYDDSLRKCIEDAEREGWHVVSDTSEEVGAGPAEMVMQGYRLLVDEFVEQLAALKSWPTHVVIQAGCGGFAGAVAAQLLHLQGPGHPMPRLIVVEPVTAACLLESAVAGRAVTVPGDLETIMAGLAVGEPSGSAWEILCRATSAFIAIDDGRIEDCMRELARGDGSVPAIVAGETGVAGLAGLLAVMGDSDATRRLELSADSSVLLVNTEGDTAPELYERIVGRSAADVRAGLMAEAA